MREQCILGSKIHLVCLGVSLLICSISSYGETVEAKTALKFPILLNGKIAGYSTVVSGSKLEVLAREGEKLQVRCGAYEPIWINSSDIIDNKTTTPLEVAQKNDSNSFDPQKAIGAMAPENTDTLVEILKGKKYPDKESQRLFEQSISSFVKAKADIAIARKKKPQIDKEVVRLRWNADVTGRPNPLNPSDRSGQERAQRIRSEADSLEIKGSQEIAKCEERLESAQAVLSDYLNNWFEAEKRGQEQERLAEEKKHQAEAEAKRNQEIEAAKLASIQKEQERLAEEKKHQAEAPIASEPSPSASPQSQIAPQSVETSTPNDIYTNERKKLYVERGAELRERVLRGKRESGLDTIIVKGRTLPASSKLAGQTLKDFYIRKFEVTWGDWKKIRDWAVINDYSDLANVGAGSGNDHPVRNVSWYDVVKWCNAKSEMEGLTPVYEVGGEIYKTGESVPTVRETNANGYRLPSEAEWEWAARGGVSSQGYTYSGSNTLTDVGWFDGNSKGAAENLHESRGTWPVGAKAANELGIYDMSGNVWEWAFDVSNDKSTDERAPLGGSWFCRAKDCTIAYRDDKVLHNIDFRNNGLGFRLVRSFISTMIFVAGGTLPASSKLAGQTVENFYVGKFEVTLQDWRKVAIWALWSGGYEFADGHGLRHRPVRNVSWYDVVKWCNAKSEMEGLTPVYEVGGEIYKTGESVPTVRETNANGYRLPSEAEWEWAARGGVSSQGYTYSGSNTLTDVGWFDGNSKGSAEDLYEGKGPWPVGAKAANELGIYDMSGNIGEWVFDIDYRNEHRVRGGDWLLGGGKNDDRGMYCEPGERVMINGFRSARSSGN